MTTPKQQATSAGVLIAAMICGTIVVLGLVGGLVALVRLTPAGTDVVPIITAIGVGAAAIAGQVLNYLKSRTIDTKVDYLANGGTDAKIRAGIADVIKPELLRDDSSDQLAADRVHRANSPSATAEPQVPPAPPADV